MKKLAIALTAFVLLSCSPEDSTTVTVQKEYVSKVSPEMIGNYNAYYGEKSPGSINVAADRIVISTELAGYDINLTDKNIKVVAAPDCYLIITLQDGTVIKLSFFLSIERVAAYVNRNYISSYGKNYVPPAPDPEEPEQQIEH